MIKRHTVCTRWMWSHYNVKNTSCIPLSTSMPFPTLASF